MPDRKELKRRGKTTLKRHYPLLVILCLMAAFLGVEYAGTIGAAQATRGGGTENEIVDAGTTTAAGLNGVWSVLAEGDVLEGTALAESYTAAQENAAADGMFALRRGVLAQAVNMIASGDILVQLWSAIYHLVHSEDLASVIFMVLSLGIYLFIRIFVLSAYTVISRRMILEARVYDDVPAQRLLFLLRVKKWMRTALTLFLTGVLEFLWGLTIVGGIVMALAYGMVPYILAEHPGLTVKQAAGLSRRMMDGHKWECLKLELSFAGWYLLGMATFGIAGVFFVNPYHAATKAEYYAALRKTAMAENIEGAELLFDTYLFEKAEAGTLERAYSDVPAPSPLERDERGIRAFFARNFGVVLTRNAREQAYEKALEENTLYARTEKILRGVAYPERLFPLPERERASRLTQIHYLRHYALGSLVLMFFTFSLIGWLWEVTLHILQEGAFVNRGVLHGPWLPIYGCGGLLILTVLYRFRSRPGLEFGLAIVLCGLVEYLTSWVLELTHGGMKWWDYSGYFLNLNGRICAEGLLVFGLGGIAVVYMVAPLLDDLFRRLRRRTVTPICLALVLLFSADLVYSQTHPNTGHGITDYEAGGAVLEDG